MLYRFVDEQKACGFPVERICEVAGVSRAAYYDWKRHRDGIPEGQSRKTTNVLEGIGQSGAQSASAIAPRGRGPPQ